MGFLSGITNIKKSRRSGLKPVIRYPPKSGGMHLRSGIIIDKIPLSALNRAGATKTGEKINKASKTSRVVKKSKKAKSKSKAKK